MTDRCLGMGNASYTLSEILQVFPGRLRQSDIPFIVRVFENPNSILSLPGATSLIDHDCIHILLGIGTSLESEAFVIGFTMGSDRKTKRIHKIVFKLVSQCIYPSDYRFRVNDLKYYNLGFDCARKFDTPNLSKFSFSNHYHKKIGELRKYFNIHEEFLDTIYKENKLK